MLSRAYSTCLTTSRYENKRIRLVWPCWNQFFDIDMSGKYYARAYHRLFFCEMLSSEKPLPDLT